MSDKNKASQKEKGNVIQFPGAAKTPPAEEPAEASLEPMPGKMVWLRCPTCNSIEYTEVVMAGGRTHNTCGTQVEEVELDIDIRAQFTMSQFNLDRLELLENSIKDQKSLYREYTRRLQGMTHHPLVPYPLTEKILTALPVAEFDPLGLLVPDVLHNPRRHFEEGPHDDPKPNQEKTPDPDDSEK